MATNRTMRVGVFGGSGFIGTNLVERALVPHGAVQIVIAAFVVALFAPFVEELFFRGLFFTWLRQRGAALMAKLTAAAGGSQRGGKVLALLGRIVDDQHAIDGRCSGLEQEVHRLSECIKADSTAEPDLNTECLLGGANQEVESLRALAVELPADVLEQ